VAAAAESQSAAASVTIAVSAVHDPPQADLTVPGPARNAAAWDNNLASRLEGARVVSFTSQTAAAPATNAIDDNVLTPWQSASGAVAAQSLTLELPPGAPPIDRVRLVNGFATGGASVKRFEVRVSTTTSDPGAFALVLSDLALDTDRVQEFRLPSAVGARYVSFTALDNYGSACCVALRSFEAVSSLLAGVPSYSYTPPNVALAAEGASAVATSEYSSGFAAALAIDGSTASRWASGNGLAANQSLTVTLARGASHAVERIRIANAFGALGQAVRNFSIAVSNTTSETSSFATVMTGTLQDVSGFQEFAIPGGPIAARHVRFTAIDNYGSTCCSSIQEIEVVPQSGPAPSVTSYLGTLYRPEMALDGSPATYWQTATNQTTDQRLDLRLDRPGALVSGIRLVGWPSATSANVRDFEAWVSDSDESGFALAMAGTFPNDGAAHTFPFAGGPRRARLLRFVAKNNYGGANTLLASLEALTEPSEGHRVSASATVLGFSSQFGDAFGPAKALDIDPAAPGWVTALGETSDQWLALELPQGRTWSVDHVALQGRTDAFLDQSPRDFEVQVSATTPDDAAFTGVLSGTLRSGGVEQHFFFPRTEARYVRLQLKNNHGGQAMALQLFAVYSPQIGARVARFVDQSQGKDAPLEAWSWSFGDGGMASDRDPAHEFTAPGVYEVTLNVSDTTGATGSTTQPYEVVASPQVSYSAVPPASLEGQSILFTDTSVDPAGIAYREWSFGDGASHVSTGPTATHVFTDDGSYTVTLRATNRWGVTREASADISVGNVAPVVDAGSDARAIAGSAWQPQPSLSDAGAADALSLSCLWQFGDGLEQTVAPCNAASARVPHVYAAPGAYTVSLTVTDRDGGVASDTLAITVFPEHAAIPDGTYLEQPYWDAYGVAELGPVAGLPLGYGGLVFARHDPNLLLVTAPPINPNAKVYSVRVTRDAAGHVSGFEGPPAAVADLPNGDGGMVYGPGGVLFTAQWPNQNLVQFEPGSSQIDKTLSLLALGPRDVSINFVPHGLPGQCSLKFVSYFTGDWWSANVQLDGSGTFDVTAISTGARIHDGGVEHLVYVPKGSPVFPDGRSVLVTEYDLGNVAAYDVDDSGNPIPATRRLVITGFPTPEAFTFDPLTGDLLVTSAGGSRVRRISGFPAPSRDVVVTPGVSNAPVGSPHGVTVRVSDAQGNPRPGVAVTVAVSAGPNVGTTGACTPNADCTTDAAGEVHFSYTGTVAGRDTVSAAFVSDSCDTQAAQAYVDWTGNAAPTATPADLATAEDTALSITLAGADADGDSLSFAVAEPPAHGTLSGIAPDLTYTPAPDFNGGDTFRFTVSDGQAVSAPATISIQVAPVNDAPIAASQSATGAEDGSLVVTLIGSDVDGDTLSFVVLSPPQHGTLSGTGDTLTYTPAPDFAGTDAFTFAASDGQAQSAPATVTLVVAVVNDVPVAAPQTTATTEDTPLEVTLQGSDVDGDALSYSVQTGPQHGTLSGTAPDLVYTPAPDFNGGDAFTFTVSDGQAVSDAATVTIEVGPLNDPPAALDGSAMTTEDTPAVVSLAALDADLDTLLFAIVTPPVHGTLSGTAPNLTYTPAADEHGPDSFTFQVSDGQASSNVATVSLAVEPVNDRPVAASQSLEAVQGLATPIVLTATDVDGDALSWVITSPPTHGTLSGAAPNLVYTSAPGYAGPDSFAFLVSDGSLDSDVASVGLNVVGETNHPPSCATARPSLTVLWPPNHKMKSLQILGVTDADGDPVTILAKTIRQDEPVEGTGDGNRTPDGTLTPLQLRAERAGGGDGRVYHVTFEATDGEGASCTATLTVCVPHDQSGGTCVDGGPLHDSTVEHP
jgi:PKD repeat protein